MSKKDLRRVSAVVSFFSFSVMGFSGLVMFFWPGHGGGRFAGGVQTLVLGLDRHAWTETHETVAIVFLISALIHLTLNWGPMKRHLGFGRPEPARAKRDYL